MTRHETPPQGIKPISWLVERVEHNFETTEEGHRRLREDVTKTLEMMQSLDERMRLMEIRQERLETTLAQRGRSTDKLSDRAFLGFLALYQGIMTLAVMLANHFWK